MEEKIIVYHKDYTSIKIDKHTNIEWATNRNIEELIDSKWQSALRKTPYLWSSPMLRLEESYQEGDTLHLKTSVTDYKHHHGTRYETDSAKRANPIYVSANIITSDNKLVFGLRDNTDRLNKLYNIAAGSVHPILDSPDGIPSLGIALYREIFEEFGLVPESFDSVKPKMEFGTESEPRHSFLYTIRLKIDSEDVKRKLEAAIKRAEDYGMKPEMTEVQFVDNSREAVKREINDKGDTYIPMIRTMLEYLFM